MWQLFEKQCLNMVAEFSTNWCLQPNVITSGWFLHCLMSLHPQDVPFCQPQQLQTMHHGAAIPLSSSVSCFFPHYSIGVDLWWARYGFSAKIVQLKYFHSRQIDCRFISWFLVPFTFIICDCLWENRYYRPFTSIKKWWFWIFKVL